MKRFFAIFMAFVLLFGSASYAVEAKTSSAQMAVMSKVDTAKALKNAGIEPSKVALLDSTEMAQTEGEAWPYWVFYGAAWGSTLLWTYFYLR